MIEHATVPSFQIRTYAERSAGAWPVDRTALAVGSRNPPRRLRTDSSMRSVVGIPSSQAGEDVKGLVLSEGITTEARVETVSTLRL